MPNRIPRISRDLDQREMAMKLANADQIKAGISELRESRGKSLERNYKPARPPARLSTLAFKDLEELTKLQRDLAVMAIEWIEQSPLNCGPVQVLQFAGITDKTLVIFCEDRDGIPLIYQIVVAYIK